MNAGRIPPISEASFRKDYWLIWTITGAACIAVGLVVAPMIARARGAWLISMMAVFVYLISLLLCRVVLPAIWRQPFITPPILYFSLPLGGICLGVVLLMRWLAPTIDIGRRTVFIFAMTMALLYAASLVWAIGVGIRRKRLGNFEIDQRT